MKTLPGKGILQKVTWYYLGYYRPFKIIYLFIFNPHPRIYLLILEREEGGREKERAEQEIEREISIGCLLYMLLLGH